MVGESQEKCKSNWKVGEMLGKFLTFSTVVVMVIIAVSRTFLPCCPLQRNCMRKCEKSGELPLVTKANAVHRRAEEKQQEVEALD